MPPPSPVPGWARGEVCRERTAKRLMRRRSYRRALTGQRVGRAPDPVAEQADQRSGTTAPDHRTAGSTACWRGADSRDGGQPAEAGSAAWSPFPAGANPGSFVVTGAPSSEDPSFSYPDETER